LITIIHSHVPSSWLTLLGLSCLSTYSWELLLQNNSEQ